MINIVKLLSNMTFQDLLKSFNLELLDYSRLKYEEIEEYEKCAILRDRIKKLKEANGIKTDK